MKVNSIIFLLLLFCVFGSSNFLLAQDTSIAASLPKRLPKLGDVLLKTDQVIVLGKADSECIDALSRSYLLFKFSPLIGFADFPTRVDSLKSSARVDYSSNPTAHMYRTVLTQTYKREGINFAGHYCFTSWGCGSPCQECAIIDTRTGKVYDGPSAGNGYGYQKDSRMLIVNPPDSEGWYLNVPYAIPEVYIWNDHSKKFERK